MDDTKAAGLSLVNMWVGFIAFLAAAVMGLYQVIERSGLIPDLESPIWNHRPCISPPSQHTGY
jgi:cytochrome c oxidase subunit 1